MGLCRLMQSFIYRAVTKRISFITRFMEQIIRQFTPTINKKNRKEKKMGKYTTTLMEIIQTQAPTSDLYTTVNGYKQLIYGSTNWKSSVISKVALYDSDIQFIVNDYLFMGLTLDDPTYDYIFKKQWVNEFINREIKWQTVNLFRNRLVAQFLKDELTVNVIYKNLTYFISDYETVSGTNQGSTITTGTDNSTTSLDTKTNERGATATLPQSSVNLDVANTVLQFADTNTIGASS